MRVGQIIYYPRRDYLEFLGKIQYGEYKSRARATLVRHIRVAQYKPVVSIQHHLVAKVGKYFR